MSTTQLTCPQCSRRPLFGATFAATLDSDPSPAGSKQYLTLVCQRCHTGQLMFEVNLCDAPITESEPEAEMLRRTR